MKYLFKKKINIHCLRANGPVYLFIILLSFLFLACPKDTTPPSRERTIHLEVLSTFTTTAQLQISVEDTTAEWTFGLIRNGEDILTATVYGNDTTFIDNGLTPSTQYTYQAQWLNDGIAVDMSLTAIAQTMAITSHNFTWEIDTLGIYPSYLNDVAIVNENDIWVVGDIRTDEPDTVHNLPYTKYNAAHWDGKEWELIKIQPQGYVQPLKCIYYISDSDIWFGLSSLPIQWNGSEYYKYTPAGDGFPGGQTINAIWGTSSSNLYFVRSGGSIVHYDGSTFTKMESGTETRLIDIWGLDENHIWVTGREFDFPPSESVLLYYNGIEWCKRAYPADDDGGTGGTQRRYNSLWAYGDTLYVTTTEGIWKRSISTNDSTLLNRQTLGIGDWAIGRIRGSNYTDVFFHRSGGFVYHYNGLTWEAVFDGQYHFPGNTFMSIGEIALKDNAVYFVGQVFRRAYIARSFR